MSLELLREVRTLRLAGRPGEALACLPAGWEQDSDQAMLALLSLESGLCHFQAQRYGEAHRDIERAYGLREHVGAPQEVCAIVVAYAWRKAEYQDYAGSAALLQAAFTEYRPEGIQAGYLLWNWGWAEARRGEPQAGADLLHQAAAVLEAADAPEHICVRIDWAEVLLMQGRLEEAGAVLRAVAVRLAEFSPVWQSRWHRHTAILLLAEGKPEAALAHAEQAYECAGRQEHRREMARSWLVLTRMTRAMGRLTDQQAMRTVELCAAAHDGGMLAEALSLSREVAES